MKIIGSCWEGYILHNADIMTYDPYGHLYSTLLNGSELRFCEPSVKYLSPLKSYPSILFGHHQLNQDNNVA